MPGCSRLCHIERNLSIGNERGHDRCHVTATERLIDGLDGLSLGTGHENLLGLGSYVRARSTDGCAHATFGCIHATCGGWSLEPWTRCSRLGRWEPPPACSASTKPP